MKPQGLAALATEGVLDQIKRQRDAEERAKLEEKAKAQVSSRAVNFIVGIQALLAGRQSRKESGGSNAQILARFWGQVQQACFPLPVFPKLVRQNVFV